MTPCKTITWVVFSIVLVALVAACGPDTIFLRPGLDTPAQHVKNGHSFLSQGKIDAANAEFVRAKSLNEGYVPAHVGIALVQGHRGNFERGLETLYQARRLTTTPEETQDVDQGFQRLYEMQAGKKD
jgi:hypothetical protein